MLTEDDEPRGEPPGKTPLLSQPSLDRLGVAELQAYIDGLRREIERVEAEIVRKDGIRSVADSFFRPRNT